MVWFQCEDCGDNLKKPKLGAHFRACSANKLSCIDCGKMFGQQSVQGHTQCISETEKYGPKGQVKPSPGKPNNSSTKPEVDINVGLSDRPPWFCSLCNTSATSKQTLLLHADGKKHRAKARAFHASNQPPPPPPVISETNKRKLQSNGEELVDDSNAKKSKGENNGELVEKKNNNIKWKKIITAVLKSNPDGILKMRKLQTQVFNTIRESSASTIDHNQLLDTLEHKINSSSKFAVNGKYVQLVAKS